MKQHKSRIDRLQVRLATLIDAIIDEREVAKMEKFPSLPDLEQVCEDIEWVKFQLDDAFRALN